MIRGYGANQDYVRSRYREATGEDWCGIDHHLRNLIKASSRLDEIILKMQAIRIERLPDDPRRRPLGHVSNSDLLAEIFKRPDLFR